MTVTTEHGTWVVPPGRAVWVPARVGHSIRMTGRVSMRTIYLSDALGPLAGGACCVVQVSPLLRESILRAVEFARPYAESGPEARLVARDRRRDPRRSDGAAAPAAAARRARAARRRRAARRTRAIRARSPSGRASRARSARTLERLLERETSLLVRGVAPAGAPAARARAARGGRARDVGGARPRLRDAERVHRDVPARARHVAGALLPRARPGVCFPRPAMLDPRSLDERRDEVAASCRKRGVAVDIEGAIAAQTRRRGAADRAQRSQPAAQRAPGGRQAKALARGARGAHRGGAPAQGAGGRARGAARRGARRARGADPGVPEPRPPRRAERRRGRLPRAAPRRRAAPLRLRARRSHRDRTAARPRRLRSRARR